MSAKVELTEAEIGRERSVLFGILGDATFLFPEFAVSLWSGSLTQQADCVRAALLMLLETLVLVTLRRIHRRRISGYDYGHGKIEQFLNIALSVMLAAGAVWIGSRTIGHLDQPATISPAGMRVAVGLLAGDVAMNLIALRMVWRAGRDGTSAILAGQIQSRIAKLLTTVIVAVPITIGAIWPNSDASAVADLCGSIFVVVVMLTVAARLSLEALPHLLDRTLSESRQVAINRALIKHFDLYDALDSVSAIKSRQSGGEMFVEIRLGFEAHRQIGEVTRQIGVIVAELEDLLPGANVTVIPTSIPTTAEA